MPNQSWPPRPLVQLVRQERDEWPTARRESGVRNGAPYGLATAAPSVHPSRHRSRRPTEAFSAAEARSQETCHTTPG